MLEARNLVKIYKPKRGVPVRALNNVSLKFPQKGMVFLLGKSGSGKSTLLNVLGGLDRYNSGEIFIKGKSARTFRQRHFDSYRNTYVGFIFQEYNILDEFSVGANIALALQLQGKKANSERINEILRQVDLEGYGNRRPNELSGGQKQRVAIARALVKNPEIIMADEPTGALDSTTGRQILTTLKKLSKEKLVIVVSHDQEFAELYADRIIELADGQVIRDVERQSAELPPELAKPSYQDDTITIPTGYQFTDEDRIAVTDYLQKLLDTGKTPRIQSADAAVRQGFIPTNAETIQMSQEGYHLIRSRLPLRHAFKLGASSLGHKKFRLIMTIFLSCVAFVLFGLSDTVASYDYVSTSVTSLSDPDSQITYASFEKQIKTVYGDGELDYYSENATMTEADLDLIEQIAGVRSYPVYGSSQGGYFDANLGSTFVYGEGFSSDFYSSIYPNRFAGFVEASEDLLEDMGAELVAGRLPEPGTYEIAISSFILEGFRERGYVSISDENGTIVGMEQIHSAQDMIGKTLYVDNMVYTICGVVDTGFDYSRYESLNDVDAMGSGEFIDQLAYLALSQELQYVLNYSLTGIGIVAEGHGKVLYTTLETGTYEFYWAGFPLHAEDQSFAALSQVDASKIVWLDGEPRDRLGPEEIVISEHFYTRALDMYLGREGYPEWDFSYQYAQADPDYWEILRYGSPLTFYDPETDTYMEFPMTIVGILQADCTYEEYLENPENYGPTHIFNTYVLEQTGLDQDPDALEDVQVPILQTLGVMPDTLKDIQKMVAFTDMELENADGTIVGYRLQNPVTFELRNLDEVFLVLKQVFLIIGLVFVVFASLLFSNFIATSVSYKKREIGILRAIGSRSNDVFRIFFAESFIISMINFVLSLGATFGLCALINNGIQASTGLLLTVLVVGPRQVILLFGVCLLVAALSSFLPVRRIAAKRPIDAIRDR